MPSATQIKMPANPFGNYSNAFQTPAGAGGGTSGGANPSNVQRVLDMLGSKGGQTALGAAGAGLQAYGQAQQLSANRKQSAAETAQRAREFAATMGENQLNSDRNFRAQQTQSGLAASPLGANQNFAQRQAIIKALLGSARDVNYTPGDPAVAAAMGQRSGGISLGPNGLDPAMLERLFGDNATQNSIVQREKQIGQVNPNNPTYNMGSLFGDSADGSENAFTTDIRTSNKTALDAQDAEHARQRSIIQAALDNNVNAAGDAETKATKAKGSSWKKKLAKIGIMAGAGIATALTGGAAAPLIGMAAGAGSGALDGGWKGALMGAATGAATGGMGGGAASGAIRQSLGQAAKSTLTNPNMIANLTGTAVGGRAGNLISSYGSLAAGKLPKRAGGR
jgi:hypothetical protein